MGAVDYVYVPVIPEILRGKVQVLVQLYRQKFELRQLNLSLAGANAELAEAHAALKLQNTRELQALNRTLQEANFELHENARRKDEFLAILAHELRNPLSAIHNGLQLIHDRALTDAKTIWARDSIGRHVAHLTRLIDDLLDASRITTGRIDLQRQPLELASIVARAIETTKPLLEARRHNLEVALPSEPVWVDGDAVRMTQIIDNLLTNAAKYTPEGGRIALAVEVGDDPRPAVIRVRDNGVGIPTEMLERIFELFTQATPSLDRSLGGLGIGLALVRGLVGLHGGTVTACSDGPGTGAEFTVRLPLAVEKMPALRVDGEQTLAPIPKGARRRRVLVVDDNTDSAVALAMWLEIAGHELRVAHTGDAGLREAIEFHPEVILLDIGLPGLNGYEVAKQLRKHPTLNAVRLIGMSGFGAESDAKQSMLAGFDHYLVKPIDYKTLIDLMEDRPAASVA
jgi:signal transduction histidine kinase/ActR/RegA family two-component response regulator